MKKHKIVKLKEGDFVTWTLLKEMHKNKKIYTLFENKEVQGIIIKSEEMNDFFEHINKEVKDELQRIMENAINEIQIF